MADTAANTIHSVSPYLVCAGAADAIAFYKRAFGAEEIVRLPGPGRQARARRRPDQRRDRDAQRRVPDYGGRPTTLGGTPVTIHLMVPDVDAAVARAVDAGATVTMEVADQFWGDRYGSSATRSATAGRSPRTCAT